jgi:hypothetical protein
MAKPMVLAARLSDDAMVVRGGRGTPTLVQSSLVLHRSGHHGICAVSADGVGLIELAATVPHHLITTSSVGDFRKNGGDVVTINGMSPFACVIIGITESAEQRTNYGRPFTEQLRSYMVTLFADFNNADRLGRVRLITAGTLADLAALKLDLCEGMRVALDDHDELAAEGTVRWSSDEEIWVAEVDWDQIQAREKA